MTSCNGKTIDNFQSISEYQRFCAWIQSELQNNLIEKTPVEDYYISAQLDEQWFATSKTNLRLKFVKDLLNARLNSANWIATAETLIGLDGFQTDKSVDDLS